MVLLLVLKLSAVASSVFAASSAHGSHWCYGSGGIVDGLFRLRSLLRLRQMWQNYSVLRALITYGGCGPLRLRSLLRK
jgi:hypothetical protein